MAGGEVSGGGKRARAGTLTLVMVASTIKRDILRELLDGPKSVIEMSGEADPVVEAEAEELEIDDTPMAITPVGREMLFVSFVLERWLQDAPQGPLELGSEKANDAVAALACGWSTTLVHALAKRPLTFPEMHDELKLSYRSLEDHVDAMEAAGQLVAQPGGSGGPRYAVTDWLRASIAPLAASARLERLNPMDDTAPIDALDVEASFLLTLPMLELPTELSGTCRLGVEVEGSGEPRLAGATAKVEAGRVTACSTDLEVETDAWATAPAGEWLDTVIESDTRRVGTGGDKLLARALLDRLHGTLFGIPVQ